MNTTKPITKAAFNSDRMKAGIKADIETSSGPAGGSSMFWAASISSSSSLPVLANMNSRSGAMAASYASDWVFSPSRYG